MGYTTDFSGSLRIEPPLHPAQVAYINAFANTRRLGRDPKVVMAYAKGADGRLVSDQIPDEVEHLAHLINELGYDVKLSKRLLDWKKLDPAEVYGKYGEFYVGDNDRLGVIDYNCAPGQKSYGDKVEDGQPGLYCKWWINDDGELEWNGEEKFYDYLEWLQYLIDHFFTEWGVLLNGEIEWQGEEMGDRGKIVVENNVMDAYEVTYKKRN